MYKEPNLLEVDKISQILFQEMENDTFKLLMDLGLQKEFTVDKKSDNELHHVWTKKKPKEHPHGQVKIFARDLLSGWEYGHDLAGDDDMRVDPSDVTLSS